jgi:hypothetical protein
LLPKLEERGVVRRAVELAAVTASDLGHANDVVLVKKRQHLGQDLGTGCVLGCSELGEDVGGEICHLLVKGVAEDVSQLQDYRDAEDRHSEPGEGARPQRQTETQ